MKKIKVERWEYEVCPHCHSDNIDSSEVIAETDRDGDPVPGYLLERCCCMDCDKEWYARYEFKHNVIGSGLDGTLFPDNIRFE